MRKYNKNSTVTYYGNEFKKSRGYSYTVTAVHKCSNGKYYHDLRSIEKPKQTSLVSNFDKRGFDYDSHSEILHSIEFGDLVKA